MTLTGVMSTCYGSSATSFTIGYADDAVGTNYVILLTMSVAAVGVYSGAVANYNLVLQIPAGKYLLAKGSVSDATNVYGGILCPGFEA